MNKIEALELIKKGLFEEVKTIYWKDRYIVLKAIEVSESGLKYADEKFHFDREIVLKAVKFHGNSLGYLLNKHFLEDQEIVLEAIKCSGCKVLEYLLGISNPSIWDGPPDKLLSNKEFIINAVKLDEGSLGYADVSLTYDPDLTINNIKKT
jgi:hypothetical protein